MPHSEVINGCLKYLYFCINYGTGIYSFFSVQIEGLILTSVKFYLIKFSLLLLSLQYFWILSLILTKCYHLEIYSNKILLHKICYTTFCYTKFFKSSNYSEKIKNKRWIVTQLETLFPSIRSTKKFWISLPIADGH